MIRQALTRRCVFVGVRNLSASGRAVDQNNINEMKELCNQLSAKDQGSLTHYLQELSEERILDNHRKGIVVVPRNNELRRCFVHEMIPFIGFGFLDNAVMIFAGDYIETSVGVALNLSVLAAAGLGNTVSDMFGVAFGGYVESVADKLGVPKPHFTPEEAHSRRARLVRSFGQAFGIVVGCLLGMFPLLLIDTSKYTMHDPTPEEEACEILS